MTDLELTYLWLVILVASTAVYGGIAAAVQHVWAGRRRFPRREHRGHGEQAGNTAMCARAERKSGRAPERSAPACAAANDDGKLLVKDQRQLYVY